MGDLSLFLSAVNISLGQPMESEKDPGGQNEFETVEMGERVGVDGRRRARVPRKTIYFASGETMEEYSTDEEQEEEESLKKDVIPVDPSKLTWGPYFWFQMWRVATSTITVCDYLGEKMAAVLGITTPKYQYAIDEYYRMKQEEEEEEEETRMSEHAEHQFQQQHRQGSENRTSPLSATVEQPEPSGASFVNVSFELDPEPPLSAPDTSRVPPPLPS